MSALPFDVEYCPAGQSTHTLLSSDCQVKAQPELHNESSDVHLSCIPHLKVTLKGVRDPDTEVGGFENKVQLASMHVLYWMMS
jgi:hypothetical protein